MSSENIAAKPLIYLAEDDEHILYLLNFMLTRLGYEVVTAVDGFKFLDLLKDRPAPDLILLDMMLPYVDGFELINQVRKHAAWRSVPVIALSALSRDDDIVRAFKAGANDYVTKPFQPQELIVRIGRYIRERHDVASGEN